MGKLHELLAVEESIVNQAEKLLAETNDKFTKSSEYFAGRVRRLERLADTPEDKAKEKAGADEKRLPTNVPDTLNYIQPYVGKMLNAKLSKHLTNCQAKADIVLNGATLMSGVPVDFLLDLEKMLPRFRQMFATMPTIDPSRAWEKHATGVWKSVAGITTQTEKTLYAVILHAATEHHPAQVKEASKEVVVGTFHQTDFSGAATSQQKADAMKYCDELLAAVKQARMRANSVDIVDSKAALVIVEQLFGGMFK